MAMGPPIYMNWLAANSGTAATKTVEYPLYSDTCFTGQMRHGPYEFLNTVPNHQAGLVQTALVLRVDEHWEFPPPDWERTDVERYHGGSFPDELAALSSLALGVRLKAGNMVREFRPGGDPKGTPHEWNPRPFAAILVGVGRNTWVLPRAAKGYHPLDGLKILNTLPSLPARSATTLVRAARLYQEAIWLAESETAMSWLMLVSAVETAANQWQKEKDPPAIRLETSLPDLFHYLSELGAEVPARVAAHIADMLGSTRKFVEFLITFLPSPPEVRPPIGFQHPWDKDNLEKTFRKIYGYRSKALHDGIPFPLPMCEPAFSQLDWSAPSEVPMGSTSALNATWVNKDTPMHFHSFEHIARHAILNWWERGAPERSLLSRRQRTCS
jgi:hypothetical protein